MKVLIVEDNISFSTELKMLFDELSIKNVFLAEDKKSALKVIDEQKPDMVTLDFNLKHGENSLEIGEKLDKSNIPFVVITENIEDSIFQQIFKQQPLAYLTKPLDRLSFKYTVQNFFRKLNANDQFVFLNVGKKHKKVMFDDILYVYAEGNYITYRTEDNKIVERKSLKKATQTLNKTKFMQVHRSYLVNMDHVVSFNNSASSLNIGSENIPVGRYFKSNVATLLMNKKRL